MTEWLTLEDLLYLADDIGVGPVRDIGLLESAAARPATTLMGADAYPSIELKAAALLHSLVCNHALVDGNKRIGWHATVVFLGLNGHRADLTQDEAFGLTMAVASGVLRDVDKIAPRLQVVTR
jgi:death-on-curing protein